ncbi:hypothetical protein FIBSPDRAFT_1013864 [Athelia psychrophila]|uniref:Uncharacterized protein n=1 Tax=Athelia psychrophila TaxID=1759441 RepID=A0A166MBR9_9AGAM|nr:hypothetical protein FIBSPDRAFT_1013864 [Fibularhizoctonia sp. CBS 109695]
MYGYESQEPSGKANIDGFKLDARACSTRMVQRCQQPDPYTYTRIFSRNAENADMPMLQMTINIDNSDVESINILWFICRSKSDHHKFARNNRILKPTEAICEGCVHLIEGLGAAICVDQVLMIFQYWVKGKCNCKWLARDSHEASAGSGKTSVLSSNMVKGAAAFESSVCSALSVFQTP